MNSQRKFIETNYDNNVAKVDVTIGQFAGSVACPPLGPRMLGASPRMICCLPGPECVWFGCRSSHLIDHSGAVPQREQPVNDRCAGAYAMQPQTHYSIHTRGATNEGMVCGGVKESQSSIWYKVNPFLPSFVTLGCVGALTADVGSVFHRSAARASACSPRPATRVRPLPNSDSVARAFLTRTWILCPFAAVAPCCCRHNDRHGDARVSQLPQR